ncbi:hypothetical protein PGT21_035271 [Puccinia graminis f. sp. tritici]|uniref:Uncharacterized protein n=1 Tax=Puccinia graminis f. sp. tritici TaxID=56615 RepID=A0A5B0PMX4_PUCGR|nr:hypothetical protein PGT21_035271 [Puccinia graminis f. sp. tritici]
MRWHLAQIRCTTKCKTFRLEKNQVAKNAKTASKSRFCHAGFDVSSISLACTSRLALASECSLRFSLIRDETISTAVPKSGPYPAFKDRSPKNAAHRGPHRRPYFTDFILGPSPDLGSRDWIGTMDWTRFRDGGGDALILAAVGRAGPSVPENPRRHSANVCYRF